MRKVEASVTTDLYGTNRNFDIIKEKIPRPKAFKCLQTDEIKKEYGIDEELVTDPIPKI